MDKDKRRKIAQETLDIVAAGHYMPLVGHKQSIALGTRAMGSTLFGPGLLGNAETLVDVVDETTLQAAHDLAQGPRRAHGVGVLNFASGKNPGGGFLRGTQAQEETLARSSALYHSLTRPEVSDYYESHRASKDPRYSDRMIFSSEVPFFRDDAGDLLPKPYYVNVLTAAAPNVRVLKERDTYLQSGVQGIIEQRTRKILQIFAHYECSTLVLGAWGCGVFGCDPVMVAGAFRTLIDVGGEFRGRFAHIRFAICYSQENLDTFRRFFLAGGKMSAKW